MGTLHLKRSPVDVFSVNRSLWRLRPQPGGQRECSRGQEHALGTEELAQHLGAETLPGPRTEGGKDSEASEALGTRRARAVSDP